MNKILTVVTILLMGAFFSCIKIIQIKNKQNKDLQSTLIMYHEINDSISSYNSRLTNENEKLNDSIQKIGKYVLTINNHYGKSKIVNHR